MSEPNSGGTRNPSGPFVGNPFTSTAVARRYVRGRPYYHDAALDLADHLLGRSLDHDRAGLAIDLGCGTGLSTRAVHQRAARVIALDPSPAMLHQAEPVDGAAYVAAAAERLPLPDRTADLATVGAAFHWFDPTRSLAELARVLRPGAALVVYTDAFYGRLAQGPAFTEWLRGSLLAGLPTPPRHAYFAPELAAELGFEAVRHDEREILLPLTRTDLVDYLLSQSNAAVAFEAESVTPDTLRDQITSAVTPFLTDEQPADVVFGVRVWTAIRR